MLAVLLLTKAVDINSLWNLLVFIKLICLAIFDRRFASYIFATLVNEVCRRGI